MNAIAVSKAVMVIMIRSASSSNDTTREQKDIVTIWREQQCAREHVQMEQQCTSNMNHVVVWSRMHACTMYEVRGGIFAFNTIE